MITTVMFDLDSTLLPFVQDEFIECYFGELCKKLAPYGYEPKATVKAVWAGTKAMIMNDGSRSNMEAFWDVFNSLNEGKPDVKELCDAFYTQEFDRARSVLKRSVDHKPMIDRLKAAGLRVVLATNPLFPLDGVKTRLSWAGLSADDFELVTHYENCRYSKPHPDYYKDIMAQLGVQPSECIMVGNSLTDDMSAEKLGITTFLIPEFAENPDNEDISHFAQGTLEDAERFILSKI